MIYGCSLIGKGVPRRIKVLRVSSDMLVGLLGLGGTHHVKIEGMPSDARIVSVSDRIYFLENQIAFYVESADFPEAKEGFQIPELELSVSIFKCGHSPQGREFV